MADEQAKLNVLETKEGSNGSEVVNIGIDLDAILSSGNAKKSISVSNATGRKLATDEMENEDRKRKRGKRGGRRRGFGLQTGSESNLNSSHVGIKSGKQAGQNWRWGQKRRGAKKQGTKNVAELTDLPDGILLVEDGDYVGYHCTYCNCVLGSTATIKNHVAGFRHQLIIETRNRLDEDKQNEGTIESESENNAEKSKDVGGNKPEGGAEKSVADGGDETAAGKNGEEKESTPPEESSVKASLKSCLEDDFATISDPVVGLDYVIEKRQPDQEALFECSLCKVICDADDMKVHIVGTRHRLMYLKTTEPQKIAELMTKNLQKAERNKEIKEYIALLMNKHGRGTIVVECSEPSTAKGEVGKPERPQGANRRQRRRQQSSKEEAPQQITRKQTLFQQAKEEAKPQITRKQNSFQQTKEEAKPQITRKQNSFQQTSQKKGNQGAFGSSKKGPAGAKRKRASDWANARRQKQLRGNTYPERQVPMEQFIGQNQYPLAASVPYDDQYYQNYSYDRPLYQVDRNEERLYHSNDYPHASPSTHDRVYGEEEKGSPKLPEIDVTTEEEAGVVMNVINSLTERFLQYKLKNIAGSAKGIFEKSLKGESLLHALGAVTDESDTRTAENLSSTSKLLKQDIMDQNWQDFNETEDVVSSVKNPMEKSRRNWIDDNDAVRARGVIDQSRRNWNDKNDIPPRGKMDRPQHDWESMDTTYPRDRMNQPRSDWNESRDTTYPGDRMNQPRSDWNESRDTTYPGDRMNQPRSDWDETRDGRSREPPQHDWDEDKDVRFRDTMDQPQRTWNETRDVSSARNVAAQSQRDWSETRDSAYGRDAINQSKHDWNEIKDTTFVRKMMSQPQRDWDDARDTRSRNMMDHPRLNWNENKNVAASKNDKPFEQSRYGWGETRQSSLEEKQNTDSFSQSRFGLNKPEEVISLRNTNFDSFNQSGKNQGRHAWNETVTMKSQNSRSFGESSVGWNEKSNSSQLRSSTSNFTTPSSHLQSSISSLPLRKNIDHPSYVDDLFDNYQKKMKAEKSRSTVTGMNSGNRSHLTPSLTIRSQYGGPSAASNFSRPSTFGQLPSSGSFPNWK